MFHLRNWAFMSLKRFWLLPLVCASAAIPQSSSSIPVKETLHYNIEWRLISAGKARMEWTAAQPRGGWQVGLHLESSGLVSKLFKVEDDYNAILNQSLCAQSSHMTAHEGSRQRETRIAFDYESHKASYLERDHVKN